MARIHVAVLRGGPSSEYDVSLASGAAVIEHLPEDKYNVKDILISRSGEWHSRGMPVTPDRALQDVDAAFIALHGEYGEDGTVQRILDLHNIPYTGSDAFGSAVAMDKGRTKAQVRRLPNVKMAPHTVLHFEDVKDSLLKAAQQVFAQFGPNYVVKPLRGGSSVGVRIANSVAILPDVLADAFEDSDAVIVEQFIQGREGTCGIVESLRDEQYYCLPPIEIKVPSGKGVFDYESKYDGKTEEICPGNFTEKEKNAMQQAARDVHEALGLSHYSRSDFIIAPSGIYFLEVNTLPGLTPASLLPKSLEAVGVTFPEFLDHLISLAIARRKRL